MADQIEIILPKGVAEDDMLAGWQIPEFHKHDRNRWWYIGAGLLVLALLIYALADQNYFFAVVTIFVAIIVAFHEVKEPRQVFFGVSNKGLVLEDTFFPFQNIERFWIVTHPEDAIVYVDFTNVVRPRIAVPMAREGIDDVRALLAFYIEHDPEEQKMPFSDRFGQWLRI